MARNKRLWTALLIVLALTPAFAYSVLSHEEVIDFTWDSDIRPALLKRFPNATEDDLRRAHAYAYGGSVIQDIGYYPFSNHKFTDTLHYVRTGDFVANLIRESHNLDEFAFALGALSHYAADAWGHEAINRAVPEEYPKLRARFGDLITYEDSHDAHLDTEFSFDVLEVAKHRYTAQQYHDYIGFAVPEEQLERAFADTYGVSLDDLLHFDDLTIGTFRFTVSKIVPEATEIAIATRKNEVGPEKNDRARRAFLYHLSRADYEREFGTRYRRPGFFARVFGFILKIVPLGPVKVLGYRNPTPATEDLYFRSMDNVVRQYRRLLQQVEAGDLRIANLNLDTGERTREGRYFLADRTYADLARRLDHDHFRHLDLGIAQNILDYFAAGKPGSDINPKDWRKTEQSLEHLRAAMATVAPARSATDPPPAAPADAR